MKTTTVANVGFVSFMKDLVALCKPRITFMVLSTTLAGVWFAPGKLDWHILLVTLVGVALVVSGANVLNMYLERDVDGLMARTRLRPLPTGRLAPDVALAFGLILSAAAIPFLAFFVNPLTGMLGAISLITYVLIYTPMKRRSTAALLVGAIPGAMPPLMGWTAATGTLDKPGLALFLILFIWQLPHFIAISLFRSDEYARAGLKVIPIERGISGAKQRIFLYSGLLVAASIELVRLNMAGPFYLFAAVVLGIVFLGLAAYGLWIKSTATHENHQWARWLFRYTLVYLPALFAALVMGH